MDGLFRRGGMWWARLVVPARLRGQAGRREFVQSTGTHEPAVGKLVASVLLAGWRRQLFELERGRLDSEKLLRMVEGSPELSGSGYVSVERVAALLGVEQHMLLRSVASGTLSLHCQLGAPGAGHVMPFDVLDPVDPLQGRSAGLVIPSAGALPEPHEPRSFARQVLRVPDSAEIATAALAEPDDVVSLVVLLAPSPAGWVFVPDQTLHVPAGQLMLDIAEVEALRQSMAASVDPQRIDYARAERRLELESRLLSERAAGPRVHDQP